MIFIKEYGYHWMSYVNDIVTNMGVSVLLQTQQDIVYNNPHETHIPMLIGVELQQQVK